MHLVEGVTLPREGLVSVPCVKILDEGLPLSVSGDNESMRKPHEIEGSGPKVAVVSVAPGSQLELASGNSSDNFQERDHRGICRRGVGLGVGR